MRSKHLKLLCAAGFSLLTVLTIPEAEAVYSIPNGGSATAPIDVSGGQVNFAGATGTFTNNMIITSPFSGSVTNTSANTGTLVLGPNSVLIGTMGASAGALAALTLNGNATTQGSLAVTTLNLGQFTLTSTGAISLPSGTIVNTKVISNAIFGNIANTGADSIAGPSVTVNVDASAVIALTPGTPLFVISAQGPTATMPVNVTSNSALYSFSGNYLNGNLTITPTLNPIIVPPGGVGSVFTALLTVAANNPNSDIATVMAAVAALPTPAAIAEALEQFNPIVDGALPQISFNVMKQFQSLWSKHLGYGRCVYAAKCEGECSEMKSAKSKHLDADAKKEQKAACKIQMEEGCFTENNCENVKNRFELWGEALGYFGHQGARQGFNGYHSDIYGGMIAGQAPLNRVTSLGLGGGYASGKVHREHEAGRNSTVRTYDATVYLSVDPTHWYLDTAFSFDFNQYRDSRLIEFPGIDRTAHSHYNGLQYSGLVATGYRFYTNCCFIITPLASAQYSYLQVGSYHEHGAQDLDLHVRKQTYNFLESSLGLKLTQIFQTRHGAFVPEVHGLWLHDFFGDHMKLQTTFSGVAAETGPFWTGGPSLDRNLGDVGVGISFISCVRLAIQLDYNYQFGKSYHAQHGLIKITQRF